MEGAEVIRHWARLHPLDEALQFAWVCTCTEPVYIGFHWPSDTVIYQHGENEEHRTRVPAREMADWWQSGEGNDTHPARVWAKRIHEYEGRGDGQLVRRPDDRGPGPAPGDPGGD